MVMAIRNPYPNYTMLSNCTMRLRALALAALTLAACGDTVTPPAPECSDLPVSPTGSVTLRVGGWVQVVTSETCGVPRGRWTLESQDVSVARVDADQRVIGVAPGETEILMRSPGTPPAYTSRLAVRVSAD